MAKPEAGLRKKAGAVLSLEKKGSYEEALALVDELAARHVGSALVLHLAGRTHHTAVSRAAAAGDKVATVHHAAAAERYLAEAKRLVPNCVGISALLARVLFERGKLDEADAEASRAIGIPNPADPADNNVVYTVNARAKNQRVERCRESARDVVRSVHAARVTGIVREVSAWLDTDQPERMKQASRKATDLANRCPNSCRAQLLSAHVKLQFARGLDATTDRRPILVRIRDDMKEAATRFDGSLVLAMFHAKLCFVLGFYEAAHLECLRAFGLKQPVDPKSEDVPPGSVNGGVYADRLSSIYQDLSRLNHRLLLVAKAHWCLMTSEKQDGFLSVGLDELHNYYDEVYEDGHWATRTISDALTSVKKTGSWRFWICPYCIGKKFPDAHSLLEHMYSKHPAEKVLRSVLDPKLSDDTSVDDNSLDEISVCKDSEDHYLFQFNKTDNIFDRLFCSTPSITDAKSFAEIQEDKCKEGKEILQKLKQILKNLPTNKLSAEYDKARPEIQCLLRDFFTTSALDYRRVILTLVKSFLWTKLMKSSSVSGDDATSKSIDNDDINSIFPEVAVVREVPIEDKSSGAMGNKNNSDSYINMSENRNKIAQKLGTFEIDICSIIASGATGQKYQPSIAKENSASILGCFFNGTGDEPGSCNHSSEVTASTTFYRESNSVLNQEFEDIFNLHSIIQILWNLKRFRDDFLKRQPACSQSCHDATCIAQILYKIFSSWKQNYYHEISYSLNSLKDAICQVLSCSNSFQNVEKDISPYIVATILSQLHMPDFFTHTFGKLLCDGNTGEPVRQLVNPANVICTKQISCECQTCLGLKESTASGDKLDAYSLQTDKVKSSAEDKCRPSGLQNVDQFSSNGPEFSTVVLYVSSEWENQDTLFKLINSIIDDPDNFEGTTKCSLLSMICCPERQLVTFTRDEDKWLLYEAKDDVKVYSSWEELRNCGRLEVCPGVLFLEVIK